MKEIRINLFGLIIGLIIGCMILGALAWLYWPCIFHGEHIYCSDEKHYYVVEHIRVYFIVASLVITVCFLPNITIKNPFYKQPFDESHPDYKYYKEFIEERENTK